MLSFNELEDVSALSLLPRLEKLDISYNKLTSIVGLGKLPFLRHFDVSGNKLSQTEQLSHITKYPFCPVVVVQLFKERLHSLLFTSFNNI
jgi:Leucine-rich repeat (LRR) protein